MSTDRRVQGWASRHDGHWGGQRPGEYVEPAEAKADGTPTLGKGPKVYFKYTYRGHTMTVECDVSPNAKVADDGRMLQGYVMLLCPMKLITGCPGAMHIRAENRTIYLLREPGKGAKAFTEDDGVDPGADGAAWLLPTFTVDGDVHCPYTEKTDGRKAGCDWRVRIAEGVAYPIRRGVVSGSAPTGS